MSVRRGINLLDVLPQTTGAALAVPDAIVEKIGVLTVVDHRSTTSADFFLHEGILQSAAEALDLDTSAWVLRIPGLTHGLPFRLAIQRPGTPAAGAQEAAAALWTLDIVVNGVEALIPGVRAAKQVGGSGVTPLTLTPIGTTDAEKRVYLVGGGVIRVTGGGPGGTQVQIVDTPDPLDPLAPTGAIVRLTARPPSFLFGDSPYGMTVDDFVFDLSRTFTPAEIVARGHDETWQGVAYKEATFFFPPSTPIVHSLSIGTRDVVIGDPGGLQGEVRLEFGEDVNDVFRTRIAIKEHTDTGEVDVANTTPADSSPVSMQFAITAGTGGAAKWIRAVFDIGAGELIPGHTDLAAVGVWWKLPTGQEGNSAETPWFLAPTDGALRYRLRLGSPGSAGNAASPATAVPTDQTELVEVSVRFPRAAGSPTGTGPTIDATVGTTTFNNVLHLRGPRTRLAGISLAVRGGTNARWYLGSGSAPTTATGVATFVLPLLPSGITSADLMVATDDGQRRIRIEVTTQGPLTIGHQASAAASSTAAVTVVGTGAASPSLVADTFLAKPFHDGALRRPASASATTSGTTITVPQGTDAEVEVPVPSGADDPLPPAVTPSGLVSSTVAVWFNWDESAPQRVVFPYDGPDTADAVRHDTAARPLALGVSGRPGPVGSSVPAQLTSWLSALGAPNGRRFFVVGRTDDLKYGATKAENDTYNEGLARARANAARDALVAAGVPSADITVTTETVGFTADPPGSPPSRLNLKRRLALPWPQTPPFAATASPVFNRAWNADGTSSADHQAAKTDPNRVAYRSAEIYAVDTGSPAPAPTPPSPGAGVPTRILVPGPDGPPPPTVVATTAAAPPVDYRVRLRVKWDSPTVIALADAIPTEAEALVAWKAAATELPVPSGTTPPPAIPKPTGPDYWEILLRWAYDARTGQTEATGSLSLPDGTLNIRSDAAAGALALGPAITALVDQSNVITDPAGEFVGAVAIFIAGAAIGELINSGPEVSSVDIDKFSIGYKWDGTGHVAAGVDYTVDLHVNVSVAGAGSLVGHLKLKYKGVGVRFDGAPGGGLAGVAITYDSLSVEVVDPGTWSLGGPLGNLIKIAASRMGNGSQWMEFDLEFAIDLGVIRLEGARIRVGLQPLSVEFRGLAASISIPNVIKGRGSVMIGDGGSFRALLAVEVIPAKLSAYGALAVDQDFVAIEVGIQLPVGIPLGNTGFGIFGFMGRFVANGTRNLDGLTNPDPVQKQLDWYIRSPEMKYRRRSGQFAFGVGAVVGTLPDGGFTFNAEGTLSIGFPDISVIFGIDAQLLAMRKSAASESGTTSTATSFRILGMVLIEPDSIMVAVRATFEIPKVLRLELPFSAFFPLGGGGLAWYMRIGTDNDATRPGSPVSLTLLPDTLDIRAWAFTLVEERSLHNLGGSFVSLDLADPLDFDGFAIGFGAGFDLKYSAGPFSIEITAFLLVGFGTKPLLFAGAAGIKGEIDLVVISLGVDGLIHFHVSPGYSYVEGHFCGHIDCFFFEVSGCVDIRFGDDPPINIPEPESPIAGMDLADHLAAVKGSAARATGDVVPTVWPDTVAVLKFQHVIEDALPPGADFVRRLPQTAALSPWSGSSELKYAFRLADVGLWKLTGGADPGNDANWTRKSGPFDAAWWMPTWREAVVTGGNTPGPSTEEGRELGLFSWDPRAWSRWLGEGSQDLPGNPSNTVHDVCDPAEPAMPSCAYGRDAAFAVDALAAFKATPSPGVVFPSRFTALARFPGDLDAGVLAALGADAGLTWQPGAVDPLTGGIAVNGVALTDGWRFPAWQRPSGATISAPISFDLSRPLLEGEVVLELCGFGRDDRPETTRVCDTMPEKDGHLDGFAGASGTKYSGPSLDAFDDNGERALRLEKGELQGHYPGTIGAVTVDVAPIKGSLKVTALDANGAPLGEAVAVGGKRQELTVTADGIATVVISSRGQPVVYRVCWGREPALFGLIDYSGSQLPTVVAIDRDGKRTEIAPTELQPAPISASASFVRKRCPKLSYALPPGIGWTRLEIGAWGGEISLVAVCGVTVEAATSSQEDGDYRVALVDLLNLWADAATTNTPTHAVSLDPSSTYEIRVDWRYQGWRPPNPGDDPPPPAPGGWIDPARDDRFRFSTAAFGLAPAPGPVAGTSLDVDPAQGGPGYDERTFDPRGIARYVTRATPDVEDAPHFLDDRIGFWFMVDHLEPLVDKYDRTLQAKVLHTRPAAGSIDPSASTTPGAVHPLDVTLTVAWQVETLTWFASDLALVEAAAASPCIDGTPAVGSSSVSLTADLEPHSEYDLLLNAAPSVEGAADEVPIARSHFRTSRYRNPTELLGALGFATPQALSGPTDALGTATLAAGVLEIGDARLDAALATLGLDPWPLPAAPRTTVIWLAPATAGQAWRIGAVLVEADEPVWRAGFRTGAEGEPVPPPRVEVASLVVSRTYEEASPFGHIFLPLGGPITRRATLGSLVERVRNAAGTRSLFVASTPIAMAGGRLYDLTLALSENGTAGANGVAPLLDRPLFVFQEGE